MKKFRFWLIKKIIGNIPVIMNVTILSGSDIQINGAEKDGIFEKWNITLKEEVEKTNDKPANRNARRAQLRASRG